MWLFVTKTSSKAEANRTMFSQAPSWLRSGPR